MSKNNRFISTTRYFIILSALILFSFIDNLAIGNERTAITDRNNFIPVFLDFPFHQQYIRETVTFVNYVRDREMSQVHIMISRHGSGSTGENYVISFIGRGPYEGMNNVITYWAPGNNSSDDTRRGLANMIQMGLVPYIAGTDMVHNISLSIRGGREAESLPVDDPWKNWVFEIFGGANFNKEASQDRFDSRWGFSADKVSEDWKIRIRPYFNLNERNFKTDDGVITSRSRRHGFQGNFIRSIDQHWSAGIFTGMLSSTFHNISFNTTISPGIEYSLYPYSEATRRAITIVYRAGAGQHYYMEETIFGKNHEFLAHHSVNLSASFQQPWGSFRARLSGSHHFHDFKSNRASLFARLDLRVIKGLSLNLTSNFDFINDLVALPAGDLSLEEILLQQRRLATNYQVSGSVGLAYSFGSQFTNVVNTRF
ncbi:MAG: hypothetical protein EA408_08560 [Marinilabiliales bacterium]|nr:MAG: hypothetical protein EA408_08560 [Marinilabiliales bacterium]